MDLTSSQSSPRGGEVSLENMGDDNEVPWRSTQHIRLPERYKDYALMSSIFNVIEPMRFNEANEHEEWRKEMNEEYESIFKKKT